MDAINEYLALELAAAYKKIELLEVGMHNFRRLNLEQDAAMQEMQGRIDNFEDEEEEDRHYIGFLERRVVYAPRMTVPRNILRNAHRNSLTRGRIRNINVPGIEWVTLNMRDWQEVIDLTLD